MQVKVRPGDTLWKYSILFGVPYQLILDSNREAIPQALAIGDTVNIPGYMWAEHTVIAGDSLWRIATMNGVSVDLLIQSNPGLQGGLLSIGSKVSVPRRVTSRVVEPKREYGYGSLLQDLNRLADIYPFLRRSEIGSSVMGKSIPEVVIGGGQKKVHFNGSIHANEWITTSVIMQFLNDYLLALTNSTDLGGLAMYPQYLTTSLSVVPMVNPDGVNLVVSGLPTYEPYRSEALAINGGSENFDGWKANIRGVDLNKQFPALWERDAVQGPQEPAPRDYSGSAPLTEPEVQALAELTRGSGFQRVLAFHTQGQVIYWGFEGLEPPQSEVLANEFAAVSGYEAVRYVDSTAGYKDWFIQDFRLPGFTLELGSGVNPLPIEQFGEIYGHTLGIMLAALYM
ncbi:M14 family zinc carboxypeptidase [Paenibacillus sp. LHD-117]|uniref:M14 family zinc carboxypeptidase n=1 Tax=Paenibacillus sp. LHD-117 TaxID=3071412 RepID=UPI0027DF0462|nr:M14 family zinc carboxypeptidase [Paenibacillus sp. LHD-117]MDQ6418162.1 M14 family zinc carboxypeptidase [Paenibacillus sp. LHD-117]